MWPNLFDVNTPTHTGIISPSTLVCLAQAVSLELACWLKLAQAKTYGGWADPHRAHKTIPNLTQGGVGWLSALLMLFPPLSFQMVHIYSSSVQHSFPSKHFGESPLRHSKNIAFHSRDLFVRKWKCVFNRSINQFHWTSSVFGEELRARFQRVVDHLHRVNDGKRGSRSSQMLSSARV